MKTDSQLQADVLEELRGDARVNPSEIAVAVHDGVVTLGGEVDTLSKRIAASQDAERVHGVRAIVNDVHVHLSIDRRPTDADIAHAAVMALLWDTEVPDKTVKVRVQNGWIWLVGEADWNYQRLAAERAVENIAGVKGVTNIVRVKRREPASSLQDDLTRALRRVAKLADQKIEVTVHDRTVRLSGSVATWSDRMVAEHVVWSAPGVTAVENDLAVLAGLTE
jgi:osmotically-inducible protein OsmY